MESWQFKDWPVFPRFYLAAVILDFTTVYMSYLLNAVLNFLINWLTIFGGGESKIQEKMHNFQWENETNLQSSDPAEPLMRLLEVPKLRQL